MSSSIPFRYAQQSKVIADSRFRSSNLQTSANFSMVFSSSIKGISSSHELMAMVPGFFAHNRSNSTILFSFDNEDYVAYMPMYKSYGKSEYSVTGDPAPYTYEEAVEFAFNNNARLQSDPTNALSQLSSTYTIRCRFIPQVGFYLNVIENTGTDNPSTFPNFAVYDCDWINLGHLVHGFGDWDNNSKKYVIFNNDPGEKNTYKSSSFPKYLPINQLIVEAPELTIYRRQPSYQGEGEADITNECGIYILNNEDNTSYTIFTNNNYSDTKWPLERGNEIRTSRFILKNGFNGEVIQCGNPINDLLEANLNDDTAKYPLVGTTVGWSAKITNLFLYGKANPSSGDPILKAQLFGKENVDRLDNEITHVFNIIVE